MKRNMLLAVALSMSLGTAALAQGRGHEGRSDRHDDRGHPHERHDQRGAKPDRHDHRGQMNEKRHAPPSRHFDERRNDRAENHRFRRGAHLPMEYRDRRYVVNDWRGHRLSAPPRGHQWVQNGSDYLLVAVASGIIVQVLLSH